MDYRPGFGICSIENDVGCFPYVSPASHCSGQGGHLGAAVSPGTALGSQKVCDFSALGCTHGGLCLRVFVCSEIGWARVRGRVELPCVGLETGRKKQGSPWSALRGHPHTTIYLGCAINLNRKGLFPGDVWRQIAG